MSPDHQTKLTPREWLLSLVGHAVILGLIIWFTPARQALMALSNDQPQRAAEEKAKPQDPEQVKEVVKSISEEQAEAAKEHVAELMALEKALNQLAKDRVADYTKQAQVTAADAAQKALEQLQKIPAGQDTTSQTQTQLGQKLQELASTNPATATEDAIKQAQAQLEALQQAASQSQIKTQEDQEKATQLLHFATQNSPEIDAQQKANDAQTAANVSQQNAIKAQQELVDNMAAQRRQADQVTGAQTAVAAAQSELDKANAAAAPAQAATDAAKVLVDPATKAFNDAQALATKTGRPEDYKLIDPVQRAMYQAKDAYDHAQREQEQLLKNARWQQLQVDGRQKQLQRESDKLAALQARNAELQPKVLAAEESTKNDQNAAKQAQVTAIAQLTAAANAPSSPAPATPPPAELAGANLDSSSLEGKDLGQLYQTARGLEGHVADEYKVYRAAELASIQKMTLADAMQAIQVAKPNREQLDTKLLSGQGATKDFASYKVEVIKARQQIESMVALSNDMVGTAEAQKDVGQGDAQLQGDQYQNMVSSATDDDSAAGKDLTGLTQEQGTGADAELPAAGSAGSQGEGNGMGSGNGTGSGRGSGSGRPTPPSDRQLPSALAPRSYGRNAVELPGMDFPNLKPLATRQIRADSSHHADWLSVDSWYVIGPFPNEGRANLNTKFPPESVIDLNAVYAGKNGLPLHWVYTQWGAPKLRLADDLADAPAIYYGYTELMFDQPEDLWIATGSDDKGTMWLNDVMVWNSNDTLKGWEPNEGYRKVHFRQGRNRILYRLENGQLIAAFSLMISTKQN